MKHLKYYSTRALQITSIFKESTDTKHFSKPAPPLFFTVIVHLTSGVSVSRVILNCYVLQVIYLPSFVEASFLFCVSCPSPRLHAKSQMWSRITLRMGEVRTAPAFLGYFWWTLWGCLMKWESWVEGAKEDKLGKL